MQHRDSGGRFGAKKRQPRRAQLVADGVAVLCPFCGEPQANRDGYEMWTKEEVRRMSGIRACASCDEPMLVSDDPHAQFQ